MRAGHTEAGCDLSRLAGLEPAAVICEIMNDDGSMARRPELEAFAEQHGLSIGTIADLIQYRATTETTVEMVREEAIETEFEPFACRCSGPDFGGTHLCLIKGEPSPERPCLVRVHVPDTLRDLVQVSWYGRGSWPLPQALKLLPGW